MKKIALLMLLALRPDHLRGNVPHDPWTVAFGQSRRIQCHGRGRPDHNPPVRTLAIHDGRMVSGRRQSRGGNAVLPHVQRTGQLQTPSRSQHRVSQDEPQRQHRGNRRDGLIRPHENENPHPIADPRMHGSCRAYGFGAGTASRLRGHVYGEPRREQLRDRSPAAPRVGQSLPANARRRERRI